MTAPPTDGPTVQSDRVHIDEETANLARRFPGVAVWFGAATRRWWALVRSTGRWCLVEAGGPRDLSRLIDSARAIPSRPRNAAPVRALPASPQPRRRSPGRHSRA
jgi:hypothetical protein